MLPTGVPQLHRRWLVFAVLFFGNGLNVGSSVYSFGLFIDPLETEFGWQRTAISASLSFAAVGSLASPLVGRLVDRYGSRPVMTCSLLLLGLSFVLRPLMLELWHWYALSFLQFLAMSGVSAIPAGRLIPVWFGSTQGRIMGLAVAGINVGGITIPLLVRWIVAADSWRTAYALVGLAGIILAVAAVIFVREGPSRSDTEDLDEDQAASSGLTVGEALHTKSFYAIMGTMLLGSFAHLGVLPALIPHFGNLGASPTLAAITVTVMAAMGLLSKPAFGYMAERITAKRAMMITLVLQCTGAILLVVSPVVAWIGLPVFGIGMGAHGALFPLLVRESFGLRHIGSILGILTLATVVPFSLGPVIAGFSFDVVGSYTPAFTFFAVLFLISAAGLKQMRVVTA